MDANTIDLKTDEAWFRADLQDRFLRYVQVHTTSDRHSETMPSTQRQFVLANMLADELRGFGLKDVQVTDTCYVIGRVPATAKGVADTVAFFAHMDTAPDSSGENVSPRVWENYDGGILDLGNERSLSPEDYPDLLEYAGDTIITADGSTLLGADDKAGVAEIMSAVRYLLLHPEIPHGELEIVFTPDEEIGRGVDGLDLSQLHAVAGFTMDGGKEGLVEAECFNAYHAHVTFNGYVIHPGTAKNKMANAVSMAGNFLAMLPQAESPEATEGRDGFYCPIEVSGDYGTASVDLIIRDFEIEEVHRRIAYLEQLGKAIEQKYPRSTVMVETRKQYLNMRDKLQQKPEILDLVQRAIRAAGIEPVIHAIRGGTDGSRLTELGLPTPNIFAGGFNFHGPYEWVPLGGMVRAAQTIVYTAKFWSEFHQQ